MTLDELKAEAKRQGYKLIKDNPMPKLLPCLCGNNRRMTWSGNGEEQYECTRCGRKSKPGRTKRETIENWNRMVKDEID